MKQFLFGTIVVALIGGTIILKVLDDGATIYVEREEEVATTTVETIPEAWLESAQEAYDEVIRVKTLEAEKKLLESNLEAYTASTTERLDAIDRELGVYWTVRANLKKEIRKTFPEDPIVAVAVAGGESTYNPNAYNPEWHYVNGKPVCQGSFGLMQIACVHHMENPEALYDVEFNLQVARRVYEARGWQPWGAYTDGGYKRYLALR